MSDDLTSPLWGTGYGSKRHLVDTSTLQPQGNLPNRRQALARCGSRWLRFFADSDKRVGRKSEAELVASRPPCTHCANLAAKETQA